MKYLKITSIAFVLTILVTSVSTQAKVMGYANVTIPNFSGIATVGKQTKENFSDQKFEKTTCKDKLSGNEMAIEVRTYSVNYGGYSNWKQAPKNQVVTISPGVHSVPATYKLNARAVNSFITEGSLYGTWNLD